MPERGYTQNADRGHVHPKTRIAVYVGLQLVGYVWRTVRPGRHHTCNVAGSRVIVCNPHRDPHVFADYAPRDLEEC